MNEPQREGPGPSSVQDRNQRKTAVGMVTSDRMNKTRRVEIERMTPHPKYGKYIRRRTVCHVHDERNESHRGDIVEIMETRPLSKLKRWRLVRVVKAGALAPLAGEGQELTNVGGAAPAGAAAEGTHS